MSDQDANFKLLFIRLDKIGDLVCTLPCDEHPFLTSENSIEKFWIIQKGNEFILENAFPKRSFMALNKTRPFESFKKLYSFLKNNSFHGAFSFQSPWWVNLALWLVKIPWRFGVLSQWHSFLFLNQGLRQKRSRAEKHEADYNFEIVNLGLKKVFPKINFSLPPDFHTPILKLEAPENTNLLSKWQLTPSNYIVVHPGMAGSALNWSQKQYIEFIQQTLQNNTSTSFNIVITGTPQDENYLLEIKNYFKGNDRVKILQNQINTLELLTILKRSQKVFAPSTGILHLAASLSVPSVGIYSPVKVQHPRRWAARGENVKIYIPNQKPKFSNADKEIWNCPGDFRCLKEKCPRYNCMDLIKPDDLARE